jgi:triosephosphate isomerase
VGATPTARSALEGLDERFAELVTVAYEPIWAIGTGLTATVAQVTR